MPRLFHSSIYIIYTTAEGCCYTCKQLLRTLLHKKINPQSTSRASSMKKYIEDRSTPKKDKEDDEKRDKTSNGSKWVKTDSECKFFFFHGCQDM
jgi:hypothetical protein